MNTREVIDDIFNIPKDGSNIKTDSESQEDAYVEAASINNNDSFEDKASRVKEKIKSSDETEVEFVAKVTNVKPTESTKPVSVKEESSRRTIPIEEILTEATKQKPVDEHAKEPPKEQAVKPESSKKQKVSLEEEEDSEETNDTKTSESPVSFPTKIDKDGWILESPASKFDIFYAAKKDVLISVMGKSGKLPIDKYKNELDKAKVDTRIEIFDLNIIAQKLEDLRSWRTRVVHIRGEILSQYFKMKRIVILCHGMLAKTEYEKPIIRQEGLHYIHMRDFEMYLADLEYLNEYTIEILKNLDSSYDSLSRYITIALPQKSVDQTMQRSIENAEVKQTRKNIDLSGYDALDNSVNIEAKAENKSIKGVADHSVISEWSKVK